MKDIDVVQLRRMDMSQLLVFAGIMKYRKLTVVAEKLGLTQSAISHSLNRLRDLFGDELFLRRPNGVEPTARATALEWQVLEILRIAGDALNTLQVFDPKTSNRTLNINAPDYEVAVFSPKILEHLRAGAPDMRLSFRSEIRSTALSALSDGSLDLAIGFIHAPGDQFEQVQLYDESYEVVVREHHPLRHIPWSLDVYCDQKHMIVSAKGDLSGIVDKSLADIGRRRTVVASVPQFFPAMTTVAETDLIATIPARLAQRYASSFGLVRLDPPVAIRPFPVSMTWHRRANSDLALMWFCDLITKKNK